MKKILIIKMGYSETLTPEISRTSSLGDVLRTTVILNYFPEDHVTWLVDEKARPLLEGNDYIDEILEWNLETYARLKLEYYDIMINLEKIPGVCSLANAINAHTKYGFRFNAMTGRAEAHKDTEKILEIATNPQAKSANGKVWQDHLANAIRETWTPDDQYIIAPNKTEVTNDIGLNFKVGSKWADKAWEQERWNFLARKLETFGYKVSWQEGKRDLSSYMDWVASCRTIITCDSLGLHLALAYRKRVFVLFGPSSSVEVFLYDTGHAIVSPSGLMEDITVDRVYKEVINQCIQKKS